LLKKAILDSYLGQCYVGFGWCDSAVIVNLMKIKPYYSKSFFLVLILLLAACTGMPVQEMSNARQAVEAARKAGADTRATTELESAEGLLKDAEKALEDGDYSLAKDNAKAARDQAVTAQDKALNE